MLLDVKETLQRPSNSVDAQLHQLWIESIAQTAASPDLTDRMEPYVAGVVFLNACLVGLQADPATSSWGWWLFVDAMFASIFLLEMLIKLWYSRWAHFCGDGAMWNGFDGIVTIFAVVNIVVDATSNSTAASFVTILRVFRLVRLARLRRLLTLPYLKELQLMVQGFMAGMRTLLWAMVLLTFAIYIVGVLLTISVGKHSSDPAIDNENLFASVPRSMLTTFRCFTGDCSTAHGTPIVYKLNEVYGARFAVPFVVVNVFVIFGLFNLIFAVYIECTLNEAKVIGERDTGRRLRESSRVSHLTDELVVKLREVHRAQQNCVHYMLGAEAPETSTDIFAMIITRDLYHLALQDPGVQHVLDGLDVPSERAALFDIIDSKNTGQLRASEFLEGILMLRGEARQSDLVGCLLALRSLLGTRQIPMETL